MNVKFIKNGMYARIDFVLIVCRSKIVGVLWDRVFRFLDFFKKLERSYFILLSFNENNIVILYDL